VGFEDMTNNPKPTFVGMESKKILELGKIGSKVTAESADNTLEVKWMMIKKNMLGKNKDN